MSQHMNHTKILRWLFRTSSRACCRMVQYILAVGVESHVPEPDTLHQTLGGLQFPIPSENRIDKDAASMFAHVHRSLSAPLSCCLPHVFFAGLEKVAQSPPQPIATGEEVTHHLMVLTSRDSIQAFIRSLHFSSQLDQQYPEIASDLCDRCIRTMVVDRPVVDPFPKRISVENTAKK